MAIPTFLSPQALAAALKGGTSPRAINAPSAPQATTPTFMQQVTPTTPTTPQVTDNPFGGAYGQGLINAALDKSPVGHWADGAGRMAQLASGHYLKAKETASDNEREREVTRQIEAHDPDMAAMYRVADRDTRAAIKKDFIVSRREQRAVERETAQATALGEKLAGAEGAELEQRILGSGNAKLIGVMIEQKMRRANDRGQIAGKVEQFESMLLGGRDPSTIAPDERAQIKQRAQAQALGYPLDALPGSQTPDQYADAWTGARDKDEKRTLFAGAVKTHHENEKLLREQIGSARKQAAVLNQVEAALDGVRTGALFDRELMVKKLAVAAGMKVDGVKEAELINALANEMAKGAREGYPGSVSNFEMQTYLKSVVSGQNTPEGNKAILAFLRSRVEESKAVYTDRAEYLAMKKKSGPALLAEGWATYRDERSEARAEKSRALLDAARAAAGVGPDGSPVTQSRTQKLDAQRGAASPGFRAAPAAAIDELRAAGNDPKAAAEFDAVFGKGAAKRALGGK